MASAAIHKQLSFDSDLDGPAEAVTQPEVYCNLRDVLVPADNDITFGVETETDRIVIDDPGSEKSLSTGDIVVAINSRLVTSFTDGRGVLEEECSRINCSTSNSMGQLRLRIMVPSGVQEFLPARPPRSPEPSSERKNVAYFVDKYLKLAVDAFEKRQFSLALQCAKRAAGIGSSAPCPRPNSADTHELRAKLADCQEFQADCEASLGHDSKALEQYRLAISMRSSLHGTDKHLSVAVCVSHVCRIYRRHHAHSLALHYALYLRDIYAHNGLGESVEMAMALTHIAMVKRCQSLLEEALRVETEALQMRLKLLTPTHPAVARSYHSIGMIRQDIGELRPEAEEYYRKALGIYTNYQGSDMDDDAMRLLSNSPSTGLRAGTSSVVASGSDPRKKGPRGRAASRVCVAGRADVLSSLSSLQVLRGDLSDALLTKEHEVRVREEGGVITRALGVALWELATLHVDSMKTCEDNATEVYAARQAYLCRVKAIDALTCLYEATHRRVVKYSQLHDAISEQHVHLLPVPKKSAAEEKRSSYE